MEAAFALAVVLALLFAFTNGVHDASNAIATLVATRAARPLPAVLTAAACNLIGSLVAGAAVADTIGGIVEPRPAGGVALIAAGLLAATLWNVATWARGCRRARGMRSSAGSSARAW